MFYKDKMLLQDFILFLNLDNGTYMVPCYGFDKYSFLFDDNNFDNILMKIKDLFVVEQDKEKLIETLSFNSIKTRLEKDENSEICFDFRLNITDKKEYWFSTVVKKLKITDPCTHNMAIISSYNINEYRLLQQKDEEHQVFLKHLESLLSETYEYIYDIDFKKGTQIRICANKNEQNGQLLKRDNKNVQNQVTENLIHPDDLEDYIKYGSAEAIIKAFNEGKKEIYYETRRLHNDGTYHWNGIDIKRIESENEDDLRAFCFIKDIDEKKKIEEIKKKAEEEKRQIDEKYKNYLNLIAANVDDVIIIFNEKDPNPLFVSSNIKRILGVEYKDIFKLFGRENDLCYDDFLYFYKRYSVNQNEYFEKEIRTDDIISRKERWLLFKNYPVIVEEGKRHIVMISDLTVKKEQNQLLFDALNDAETANQTRSKFLSQMSHEIRTPLNAIIGLTEVTRINIDNKEKVNSYMSKLNNSSKYLLNLLNNVLDMSKIENDQMSTANEPFNLNEAIDEAITIIEQLTSLKKQELVINNFINNFELIGDKVRLIRILMNIFSNAAKFTPEYGKIEFEINEILNTESKVTIRFVIRDNGIGMEESFIEKIYEPFSQERQKNYSLNIYGTGLGMSITKNLVSVMDGNIFINSELGKGSEFIVDIPFKKSFVKIKSDEEQQENFFDFSGKRVLIAEDNELNLEIAKELLEIVGFEVDTADNGQVVIDKFNKFDENYYDAIIMDLQMPEIDGLEATYAVRNSSKLYAKSIPIVAMSANTNDIDVAKSLDCGMNGHISKPVNRVTLYEELNKHINNE